MVHVSEIYCKVGVCNGGSVVPTKNQIFVECATLEYLAPLVKIENCLDVSYQWLCIGL